MSYYVCKPLQVTLYIVTQTSITMSLYIYLAYQMSQVKVNLHDDGTNEAQINDIGDEPKVLKRRLLIAALTSMNECAAGE